MSLSSPSQAQTASTSATAPAAEATHEAVDRSAFLSQLAPGTSALHPLQAAHDAYAARVALIRAARHTLDLQYYIWHPDVTGILLLDEVRQAADRGVKVRMLLDDNGIGGLDPDLVMLQGHPQIEVRLFNPFLQRWFKPLGYVLEFRRLNRRMHNKSLTADSLATIVGGRNVGDVYFGADADVVFSDLDMLAVGPVAEDVTRAFDAYWGSALAFPAPAIIGEPSAKAIAKSQERALAARQSARARDYQAAVTASPFVQDLLANAVRFERAPAKLFCDPVSKAEGKADADTLLANQMAQVLGQPAQSVDIVSPYFVPGKQGTQQLVDLARRGIAVRVVTNSLSANDVAAVHSGYARWRKELLQAGVQLYEVSHASSGSAAATSGGKHKSFIGSSSVSLHGKTFAVDKLRVFVGSFNFDPRSVHLNTEMGLIIDSPTLAGTLAQELDAKLADVAFEVKLAPDGSLRWLEQTASGVVEHRSEPYASLGLRIVVALLSLLPIEALL